MDWNDYRRACDQPDWLPRAMLERTRAVLAAGGCADLVPVLDTVLAGPVLPRPPGARADPRADMLRIDLDATAVVRIVALFTALRGRQPAALRGHLEAWTELARSRQEGGMAP